MTSSTLRPALLAVVFLAIGAVAAAAAPRRGDDPDWPCRQRLVPMLAAASFWTGPDLAGAGEWQAVPEVAALVAKVTPRRVSAEEGEAAITAFATGIAAQEDRAKLLTLAFAGILDETNRERSDIIHRILDLGHRQHDLAEIASKAGEELGLIPADATGEEAARRSDLEQRFAFVTRAFEGTQRTMRYACEVPVQLEARLGRYARALQAHL
jgi:hypothetical protein